MKLIFPLTILLVLASCTSTEAQKTTPKNAKKGLSSIGPPNGESPIVVADGASLHVRNKDYLRVHGSKTASVDLGYQAVDFQVNGGSPQSLANVAWKLTLSDGTTLSMDPKSGDPFRIDIKFHSQVLADDPNSDGPGLYEQNANLDFATLTINGQDTKFSCPSHAAGVHDCRMVIRYCQNRDCS